MAGGASTAYAVDAAESANPPTDRYLAQIRIVACAERAFGFMIENGSNGVYRVRSRPWLVTK